MLHVKQCRDHPIPDRVLRGMFAARKSVFVDLLKWEVPVIDGRFEVDEFDDEHAEYLILSDDSGGHLGSARLLPTTRPHILDSLYPQLCEEAPPRAPDVFEITRFCLDRGLSTRERRYVRDTLVVALTEHALLHGIRGYSAIAEIGWLQQILAFGWRCSPLGLPQSIEGRLLGALSIEIDCRSPHLLAAAGIIAHPALLDPERRAAA